MTLVRPQHDSQVLGANFSAHDKILWKGQCIEAVIPQHRSIADVSEQTIQSGSRDSTDQFDSPRAEFDSAEKVHTVT